MIYPPNINNSHGVVGQEELKLIVSAMRQSGETIVMTNGCFDILHLGHISYLEQARLFGDRLIVAVNDDRSVCALKGGSRPINPLLARMTLLSALRSVDWVVPFSEPTPQRLISEILPDVLVKGGDYLPEDIAGGGEVIRSGGMVEIIALEPGYSTSMIIAKICGGG